MEIRLHYTHLVMDLVIRHLSMEICNCLLKEINKDENLTVSFTVENTGKMRGTEICQLYLTDKVSSVSLPESLKRFFRVELAPGEKKTVEIILTPEHFSLINADMQRVVEPGLFEISVGPSSSATIELKGEVTVK